MQHLVQRATLRESRKGHLFHRLADDVVQQRTVVHVPAIAHDVSVVGVTEPRSNQMCAEWWSAARFQLPDASLRTAILRVIHLRP